MTIGVIGGSGIYELEGLERARWQKVDSPFGEPSDELLMGEFAGVPVVFLPRHGRGHRIPPSFINYRANIDALKRAGVTDLLSFSAVGSLKEEIAPGAFVLVDQFLDRTCGRAGSFFDIGCVGHVPMAKPVCGRLGDAFKAAASVAGMRLIRGGTHVVIEGPQFSTQAESRLLATQGMSVIGMTNMPEAKLAREAELCYAVVAMVTDYDSWHPGHDAVTVEQVVTVMKTNIAVARRLLMETLPRLAVRPPLCPERCDLALDGAIMTAPAARDPALLKKLGAVAGRVL